MVRIRIRQPGRAPRSSRQRLESGRAGHLDVEQGDIGVDRPRRAEHLVAAGDLRHHLDVGLEPEQARQRAAHHALILGQQDPNHGAGTGTRTASL